MKEAASRPPPGLRHIGGAAPAPYNIEHFDLAIGPDGVRPVRSPEP